MCVKWLSTEKNNFSTEYKWGAFQLPKKILFWAKIYVKKKILSAFWKVLNI